MDKVLDKKLDKKFGNFWRWGARAVRLLRSRRRTVLFIIKLVDLSGQSKVFAHMFCNTNYSIYRNLNLEFGSKQNY